MYTITTYTPDGLDIIEFTCPIAAVENIQGIRQFAGWRVEYTGDPFADAATLAAEEG